MSRMIRKYPNRRLYDTEASQYITLEDLKNLIVSGEDVQVQTAKSKKDVTREVLLQLVSEQELLGKPILNETILLSLIRFYGNPMQGMASSYLEQAMVTLQTQREQLSEQMQSVMQDPVETVGKIAQQNVEWLNQLRDTFLQSLTPDSKKPNDAE